MVAPGGAAAVLVDVQHREVCHESSGRSPVRMVLARFEVHAITRPDDLDRAATTLRQADAFGHKNALTSWVRVPRRTSAGGEMYAARAKARWLGRRRKRQQARGLPPIYDRAALRLSADERSASIKL